MPRSRHAVMAAAVLALLTATGLAHANARTVTGSIALHRSDLPAGFKQTMGQFTTNAQTAVQANISLALLNAKGRLIGYQSAFQRTSSGKTGYTTVEDTVTDYKAASGAAWGYTTNTARYSLRTSGTSPLKLARVGAASSAFTGVENIGKGVQVTLIVFYDRTYSVGIELQAQKGVIPKAALLRYARLIDGRIKSS